jgi:hypothetical protein
MKGRQAGTEQWQLLESELPPPPDRSEESLSSTIGSRSTCRQATTAARSYDSGAGDPATTPAAFCQSLV